VEVSLTLFIDLVLVIFFKQEVLFVAIVLVKLCLFLWGQLLSQMMPSRLR
jgi:hypothetical protein